MELNEWAGSYFYVRGPLWFVVRTKDFNGARSYATKVFGRGKATTIRQATNDEIFRYTQLKGDVEEDWCTENAGLPLEEPCPVK